MNHIRYYEYGCTLIVSTKSENQLIGLIDSYGNLHAMCNRDITKAEWAEIDQVADRFSKEKDEFEFVKD